ncbi:MAG TPA: TIGR00266 family protein [Polyangiales bacterium]|nr:TIGR00266 family protein [Polyangiales bacterium]
MQTEIHARPSASVAKLTLDAGETVTCEVGAMIAMSTGFHVETTTRQRSGAGGLLAGLKRMVAGENFFLNQFTARANDEHVIIGPGLSGDVIHHRLDGGTLIVQGSSWLASGPGISVDASFQGVGKALFSGESVFWLKCSGRGDLLLSSFGAVYSVDIRDSYVVDSGHIVAFEDTLQFSVGKLGDSWLQSLLSGEGFVCHFSGQGRLYCQTHSPKSFGQTLGPMLSPR